jgi:hypothetical protein
VLAGGLHEFIDFLQRYLVAITNRLGVAFFGHPPAVGSEWRGSEAWPPFEAGLQNQSQA